MANPEIVIDFSDVEPDTVPEMKTPITSAIKNAATKAAAPKPSSAPRATASKAAQDREMETACKVMENLYDALAVGLLFVSPTAGSLWAEKIARLNSSNESAFAADADLRRAVIRFGSVSGKAAFITAHATAVLPVAVVAYADIRGKQKKAKPVMKDVPAEEAAFQQTYVPRAETRPGSYPNQHLFE